ncbi:MAG: hypothetical protein ACLTDV_10600 [Eubacterium sp.]
MKNKKLLAKLIFVAILLLIIWYTFKDSAEDIVEQLGKTSLTVLVAIMAATVIYHLFEAWITYSLARRYNPKFKYREAVYCAFYCSFYRLSTLGSGSGVAAIVYLGKKGRGIFGSNRTLHDPVHGAQSQRCVVQRTFVRVKLESNVV